MGRDAAGIWSVIEADVLIPIMTRRLTSSYSDALNSALISGCEDLTAESPEARPAASFFIRFRINWVAALNCGT